MLCLYLFDDQSCILPAERTDTEIVGEQRVGIEKQFCAVDHESCPKGDNQPRRERDFFICGRAGRFALLGDRAGVTQVER